jgi:hypothetical protein
LASDSALSNARREFSDPSTGTRIFEVTPGVCVTQYLFLWAFSGNVVIIQDVAWYLADLDV